MLLRIMTVVMKMLIQWQPRLNTNSRRGSSEWMFSLLSWRRVRRCLKIDKRECMLFDHQCVAPHSEFFCETHLCNLLFRPSHCTSHCRKQGPHLTSCELKYYLISVYMWSNCYMIHANFLRYI